MPRVDLRQWSCSVEDPQQNDTDTKAKYNRCPNNSDNNEQPNDDCDKIHTKYYSFARNDHYGVAGRQGPPFTVIELLRIARRIVCLFIWIICAIIVMSCIFPLVKNRVRSRIIRFMSQAGLYLMGFETTRVQGVPQPLNASIVVANHVSYLDPLVFLSVIYSSFVAKESVRNVMFWGRAAVMMGCVFVPHGDGHRRVADKNPDVTVKRNGNDYGACNNGGGSTALTDRLTSRKPDDSPVIVFSEGTTTNGRSILPFRSGAFLAGLPVQPVLLQYGCGPSDRFDPAWETISFKCHLVRLLAQRRHRCSITFLPPVCPPVSEGGDWVFKGKGLDVHRLERGKKILGKDLACKFAEIVRCQIADAGHLKLSHLTYTDKRTYHDLLRQRGYS